MQKWILTVYTALARNTQQQPLKPHGGLRLIMIIHPHTSVPHRYHNIWIAIATVYCSSACTEFHVVYVPLLQSLGLNNYYHQTLYIAITDARTYIQTLHTHICTCIHTYMYMYLLHTHALVTHVAVRYLSQQPEPLLYV